MNGDSIIDDDLPKLKALAGEFLAAEAPQPELIEQIAGLASDIAIRWRAARRQRHLDQLADGAHALLAGEVGDLRARLADAPLDELSRLTELLDHGMAAQNAFERTDADLMAARDRGEYAAMAPLAIEADTHRNALATATAAFAEHIGRFPAKPPMPLMTASGEDSAGDFVGTPQPHATTAVDEASPNPVVFAAEAELAPVIAAPEAPAAAVVDLDMRPTSQAERRRIRDLIRQMRSADETP